MRKRDKRLNDLDAEVRQTVKEKGKKALRYPEIQTSIRVDAAWWRMARMLALEEGRTVSELIVEALDRYRRLRAYQARYKARAQARREAYEARERARVRKEGK